MPVEKIVVGRNGLAAADYIIGMVAMVVAAVVIVVLPIRLFASRKAKYPFSQAEMERFNMKEKIEKHKGTGGFRLLQK